MSIQVDIDFIMNRLGTSIGQHTNLIGVYDSLPFDPKNKMTFIHVIPFIYGKP
jgi:hypothetical protein